MRKYGGCFILAGALSLGACESIFPLDSLSTETGAVDDHADGGNNERAPAEIDGGHQDASVDASSSTTDASNVGSGDAGSLVQFIDSKSAMASLSPSLAISAPVGIAPGDYLVLAAVEKRGSVTASVPGWETISMSTAGGTISATVFVRRVQATEPSSYTVSFFGGATAIGAVVAAYRNVNGSTQIAHPAVVGRYNSTKVTDVPPVVVTNPNSMVLYFYYDSSPVGASGWSPVSALNERADNGYVALFDTRYPNSTPSGAYTGPGAMRDPSAFSPFDLQAIVLPAQ